jgi:IclR family KDG regulon transcriptional repressor
MPKISGPMPEGVQAAVVMLRTIEFLSESRKPVGVTALAHALGTTKSRIHRHLQTLLQQGYVIQAADSERYAVGPRLVTLARRINEDFDVASFVLPALQDLRDSLGHFAIYSQIEDNGMRVRATVSGTSPIEIGVKQGSLLPFHASAQGKLALAFGPDAVGQRILHSKLERFTPHTITKTAALDREIATIRRQGWAVAPNEVAVGLNALAAPVRDASGRLVGAVGIVDLAQFIAAEPAREQIQQTVAVARRISDMLGYTQASAAPRDGKPAAARAAAR